MAVFKLFAVKNIDPHTDCNVNMASQTSVLTCG